MMRGIHCYSEPSIKRLSTVTSGFSLKVPVMRSFGTCGLPEQIVEQKVELPVLSELMTLI